MDSIEKGKVSLSPKEDLEIPEDAVSEGKSDSKRGKPSNDRGRNNRRNGSKPSGNGNQKRKRVSFEDEFEKGL